jgi:hypothetical protein
MIRYYVFRLNDAQTFQEAKQLLHEALNHKALTPNSILEHLGPPNKQFTFWFFCYLDSGNVNSRSIMDCFSNELETNCDIMYYWSYFVRWRLGTRINSLLDGLMSQNESLNGVWVYDFHDNQEIAKLRKYGVLWFLGVPSTPRLLGNGELSLYLRRYLLSLNDLTYDNSQNRCIGKQQGLPPLKAFSQLRIPIPRMPLPGWNDRVPDLSGIPPQESFRRILIEDREVYDGIWPRPFKARPEAF